MNDTTFPRATRGPGMEGATARWYASLTHKSLDRFQALARRVADRVPRGRVLEVAPGPGYFAIELAKIGGYEITGLDISHTFVEIARRNAAEASLAIDFQQGNASQMPFADESFDFLVCSAAFKNFAQPVEALREMYRVLKPGGRAMIVDLRRDANRKSVFEAVEQMHAGPIDRMMTKVIFRFMLLKRAYTTREIEEMVGHTEFPWRRVREDGITLEVWLRKPAKENLCENPAMNHLLARAAL